MTYDKHTPRRAIRMDDVLWEGLGQVSRGRSRLLRALANLYLTDVALRRRVDKMLDQ